MGIEYSNTDKIYDIETIELAKHYLQMCYNRFSSISQNTYMKFAKENAYYCHSTILKILSIKSWNDVYTIMNLSRINENNIHHKKALDFEVLRIKLIEMCQILKRCPTINEYMSMRGDLPGHCALRRNTGKTLSEYLDEYCSEYSKNKDSYINKDISLFRPDMENEIKRIALELGRTPKQKEFAKLTKYNISLYYNVFGCNYNNILKEVGLATNKDKILLDNDMMLKLFYDYCVKFSKMPMGKEFINKGIPGRNNYIKRFGSIQNVCNLIGINYDTYFQPSTGGTACLDNDLGYCRSIMEKDITNFLILNKISYEKEYPYSKIIKNDKRRFDWKIIIDNYDYYIEYAGLMEGNPFKTNRLNGKRKSYIERINDKIDDMSKNGFEKYLWVIYPTDVKKYSLKYLFESKFLKEFIDYPYDYNTTHNGYNDLSLNEIYEYMYDKYKTTKIFARFLSKDNCALYLNIRTRFPNYLEYRLSWEKYIENKYDIIY